MFTRPAIVLLTALLMFPQIAETIYSPALTDISARFAVPAQQATQTLSFYFFGFAAGVLLWGRISDLYSRRSALLAGLGVYALGTLMALIVTDFRLLLAARVVAAVGAATGSVVTQTVLRDRFSGHQLASIFSFIGIALAVSPAVGVWAGGVLVACWGFYGVFVALTVLALLLLLCCAGVMPETRPAQHAGVAVSAVARRIAGDKTLWLAVLLVASFNISLFSYYSLAPFIFSRLHLSTQTFGYSGAALAAGSLVGAQLNRWLLKKGVRQSRLLMVACIINLTGSAGVFACSDSPLFLLPMALVASAFAMAIPVVLASALNAYTDCRGTAGALFGLFYYLLTGAGLVLSGWGQRLGEALLISAVLSGVVAWLYLPQLKEKR